MASHLSNKERMAAIADRREQLDKKIRSKERRISRLYDELSAPSTTAPVGSVSALISNAGTIASIIDGVLMGYRVMSRLRRIFK